MEKDGVSFHLSTDSSVILNEVRTMVWTAQSAAFHFCRSWCWSRCYEYVASGISPYSTRLPLQTCTDEGKWCS